MSHDRCGYDGEIYVELFVEIPYLFHHEMLYALSLDVTVKKLLAILSRLSKSEAANGMARTSTASSGHGISPCRTAS